MVVPVTSGMTSLMLGAGEFHRTLSICYTKILVRISGSCNGSGGQFVVGRALDCQKGGLVD